MNKENILNHLRNSGYLEYGKIIPSATIEKLIGEECKENWDFLGPFLEIKELLEDNGYLCTTSKMEFGNLKIYDASDQSWMAEKRFTNHFKRMKHLQKCTSNAKTDEFTNKELNNHLHVCNKISFGVRALNSSLARV